MFKSKVIFLASAAIILSLVYTDGYPCDVAVVSARVSTTGRPFIWKNRDCSASWHQEIKYFNAVTEKAGAYIMVIGFDDVAELNNGTPVNPSGGVNQAGFAISCTSVYEEFNPLHELFNINTDLIRHALQECATLDDFDALLKRFKYDHIGKIISGNFVAIDARGGAALYECFTGNLFGMLRPVMYRKYDANNGRVVEFNGLYTYTRDRGDGDGFIGFVNRANANTYIPWNYGEERRWRAEELLGQLAASGRLNYRNCMTEVAKDTYGKQVDGYGNEVDQASRQESYSSTYCISRAATRLAMVVDGVAPGGDPRLSTFWCALGEPSTSVFIPYYVYAGEVSWLAWIDDIDIDGNQYDLTDASMLARAANRREIYENLIYDSNNGDALWGMDDKTMNKTELRNAQTWTQPIEDFIFQKNEELLADMTVSPSYLTRQNLKDFSHYCAAYVYANYNEGDSDMYAWTFEKPWSPAWVGYTRGGFENDGWTAVAPGLSVSGGQDASLASGLFKWFSR